MNAEISMAQLPSGPLKPPAPYFGSKTRAAPLIWSALGADVPNYVEPFCGMAGALLARPAAGVRIETVNDRHAFIPNLWRAIQQAPDEVAHWADQPVHETSLHAVHRWLVAQADDAFVQRMMTDPDYFDAKIAGRWVWGKSTWLGAGWCSDTHIQRLPLLCGSGGKPKTGVGVHSGAMVKKLPRLQGASDGATKRPDHGVGVHRRGLRSDWRARPALSGQSGSHRYGEGVHRKVVRDSLSEYFQTLADRLRYVRITCGDWRRVLTPAVTISHGVTGVLLDPPYATSTGRKSSLYVEDDGEISAEVRQWALEHGEDPRYRIVLCGLDGEHDLPGWRQIAWNSRSNYKSRGRERLWLSPHCQTQQAQLPLLGPEEDPQ